VIRAVLDTNVLVSSLLNQHRPPAAVVRRWRFDRAYELIITDDLLAECARVLRYPHRRTRHGYTDKEIDAWIAELRAAAVVVVPAQLPPTILADLDDDALLAAAVGGSATHIVSGDKHLRVLGSFQGIEIVLPAAFLHELERGS